MNEEEKLTYYQKHKHKILKKQREKYRNNSEYREKIINKSREYYKNNTEKVRGRCKLGSRERRSKTKLENMTVLNIILDIAKGKPIPRFYIDDKFREYYMKDGYLYKHRVGYETDEFDEPVYWNIYKEWFEEKIHILGDKENE